MLIVILRADVYCLLYDWPKRLAYLVLKINLEVKYCYFSHLKDGEDEAKRRKVIFLTPYIAREWLNSRSTWPQPLLSVVWCSSNGSGFEVRQSSPSSVT